MLYTKQQAQAATERIWALRTEIQQHHDGAARLLPELVGEILATAECKAWTVLGHPTWADYCREALPPRLYDSREDRQALVTRLSIPGDGVQGMSNVMIAETLQISDMTVGRDLEEVASPVTSTNVEGTGDDLETDQPPGNQKTVVQPNAQALTVIDARRPGR
jgi:hypothetical protein